MSRLKTHVALPVSWRRWPWAGWSAGLVWLLVAASAVQWGLRLWVQGRAVPAQAQTVGVAQASQGDPARLFARAAPVSAPAASPARDRFRVLGVVAATDGGFAVMSVDGKPPRAYRVGASVDAQWVVLGVQQRRVDIGPGGGQATVVLDLPAMPAAATGQLPGLAEPGVVMQSEQPPMIDPRAGGPDPRGEGAGPAGAEPALPEAPIPR